ncbi:hypothetical protein [Thermus sp.]|uniref:hypothetical protein n=1 Tax=Thermus sp. TaxID=275 RepID=UPI0025CFF376|nr:hypothetical protein [Thermus sp.]MCS6867904.1 hypothetical protein [Thermus sp.]
MSGSYEDWRHHAHSAAWLTTADVSRRLGVAPGTVRHYGEVLRRRGYPLRQGPEGEWLWPPEVVELTRIAYHAARSVSPRMVLEDVLDLLEQAATYTLLRREPTLRDLVARVARGLEGLEEEREALEKAAGEGVRLLREATERAVQSLSVATSQSRTALQEAAEQVARRTTEGQWACLFTGGFVLLYALTVMLEVVAGSKGFVEALLRYLPWLGVGVLGAVVGYWLRGAR